MQMTRFALFRKIYRKPIVIFCSGYHELIQDILLYKNGVKLYFKKSNTHRHTHYKNGVMHTELMLYFLETQKDVLNLMYAHKSYCPSI